MDYLLVVLVCILVFEIYKLLTCAFANKSRSYFDQPDTYSVDNVALELNQVVPFSRESKLTASVGDDRAILIIYEKETGIDKGYAFHISKPEMNLDDILESINTIYSDDYLYNIKLVRPSLYTYFPAAEQVAKMRDVQQATRCRNLYKNIGASDGLIATLC